MPQIPSGTVTFLFTDIEGSTRLWQEHPDTMPHALARHDDLLQRAIAAHSGSIVKTTGDGCFAAFATAPSAVAAVVDAQRALAAEAWPHTGPLRVRMGLHTGTAELRDGDYFGTTLNRAARLMAAAHGGQTVCSAVTAELVRDDVDQDVALVDLGEHNLRDLARAEHVFQLTITGIRHEFPPLRSLEAFAGNLPLQSTSFVGRDTDLVSVTSALGSSRLVTLTGVGGVGKTRLSLQAAAELLPRFPEGAWFCELAAATEGDSLAQVVASTLGVVPLAGMTLGRSILEFLRTKTLLLVFDNCEHLLDEVSDLAGSILRGCPDVRVLASSREGLGLPGEQILAVRSLAMPVADAGVDAVAHSDAAILFAQRAASARAGFTIDQSNMAAIAEICRRLDGIPLAIELAAARVATMNPADVAAHIDERFRLLTGGRRGGIERHQTLRATVEWSYSLLEPIEQTVFDRLGVFSGGFDAEGATAVVSSDDVESWDIVDAMAGLVAKSMVVIDDSVASEARYHLLETLRAFALEQLADRGESDVWRRRHAVHFAALTGEWGPRLRGSDELMIRRRLRTELDNVRAAVTWALDRDDDDDRELGVRIVVALTYEVTLDRSAGYGVWADRALNCVERWQPGQRSAVLGTATQAALQRGDMATARSLADEAMAHWQLGTGGDLQAPIALASAMLSTGEVDGAIEVLVDALAAFDRAGAPDYSRANLLAVIAMFHVFAGNLADARRTAEESVRISRRVANPSQLATALAALGYAWVPDDPRAALAALDESLALTDSGASDVVLTHALSSAAVARAALGQTTESLELLSRSLRHSVFCGDLPGLAGAVAHGLAVIIDFGRPELLVLWTATIDENEYFVHDHQRELVERAEARAAQTVDPERRAEIRSSIAALTFDEAVDRILAELDDEIAAPLAGPDGP